MVGTDRHYTAMIEINEVERRPGTGRGDDRRDKREIARVTVRADSLEALVAKVGAHTALISE